MLIDLDSLLGERRWQSVKYRFLSKVFDPRYLPPQYAGEISILHATEGFSPDKIRAVMLRHPGLYESIVAPIIWRDELAAELGVTEHTVWRWKGSHGFR